MRVCSQAADDPMGKNETLELIKLYWKLSDDGKREAVLNLLKTMNSME